MQFFGIKIRQLRLAKDSTQQQLAERMDVTRATIEALIKLSTFFRVPSDYLLGLSDEKARE